MYLVSRVAPDLSLAPTVGSRVLLAQKVYELDFILDDQSNEAEYLLIAARYKLVGKVLRETTKAFFVRFDIPQCCLSQRVYGERPAGRSARHTDASSPENGLQQYRENGEKEEEEEEEGQETNKGDVKCEDCTCAQEFKEKEIAKQDGTDICSTGDLSVARSTCSAENSDVFEAHSSLVTSIMGPLGSGESTHNSDGNDDDEREVHSESPYELVRVLATTSDFSEAAQQTSLGVGRRQSSLLCAESVPHPASDVISDTKRTGCQTHAVDSHGVNCIHVSLTVAKRSCVSLLQYLLSRHDARGAVMKSMAARNFKEVTNSLVHVIVAQRELVERQRSECFNAEQSISLTCERDVYTVEPPPSVDLFVYHGWRARLNTFFDNMSNPDNKSLSAPPFFSMAEPLSRCGVEFSDVTSSLSSCELDSSPYIAISKELTLTMATTTPMSIRSRDSSNDLLSSRNSPACHMMDEVDLVQTFRLLRMSSDGELSLAPLYALLSFARFCSGQYEQSVEDAVTALLHDDTCVEAHTRLVTGLLALGRDAEALAAAAVAYRRCAALSAPFQRIARVAHVSAFYRKALSRHGGVEVLPYALPSVAGAARVRNNSMMTMGMSVPPAAEARTEEVWLPSLQRAPHKANRSIFRPMSLAGRVQQAPQQQQQQHQQKTLRQFCQPNNFVPMLPHISPFLEALLPSASPPMEFVSRSLRARVMREFEMGETIASEEASLFVPLWFMHMGMHEDYTEFEDKDRSAENKEGDEGTATTCLQSVFCAYCARPLSASASPHGTSCFGKTLSLLRRRSRVAVPCGGGCGNWYCGDVCQSRAAMAYHAVECPLFTKSESGGDANGSTSACGHHMHVDGHERYHDNDDNDDGGDRRKSNDHCLDEGAGLRHLDRLELSLRAAISGFRDAFSKFHARIDSLLGTFFSPFPLSASLSSSLHGVTTSNQITRVTTTALIVAGRMISSVLSLILPIVPESIVGFRDRSAALTAIIERCTTRGISSAAAPSWDWNSLCLAEEIFHELRIPFFADANHVAPATRWELLNEKKPSARPEGQENQHSLAANTASTVLRDAFSILTKLLSDVDAHAQQHLLDEPIGVIFTSESTASAVRLFNPSPKGSRAVTSPFPEWTCGRLLRFIGCRRFAEQLWDYSLSSHAIVPIESAFAAAPRRTPLVATMGPLTSAAADLSRFGGAVCSRFAADAHGDDGASGPFLMSKTKTAESMVSFLSIASPQQKDVETLSGSASQSFTAMAILGNVHAAAGPGRRVTLRARRLIARGEELRYEVIVH